MDIIHFLFVSKMIFCMHIC